MGHLKQKGFLQKASKHRDRLWACGIFVLAVKTGSCAAEHRKSKAQEENGCFDPRNSGSKPALAISQRRVVVQMIREQKSKMQIVL